MEQKKLANELTTEDLLNTLQDNSIQKYRNIEVTQDNVYNFISFYNFQAGIDKVSQKAIQKLYKKWSKSPITQLKFTTHFNTYFLPYKEGSYTYYLLNESSIDINKKILNDLAKVPKDLTKILKNQRHFEMYLKKFGIVPGKDFVSLEVLYYLYDKWTYEMDKKKDVLTKYILTIFLGLFFQKKANPKKGKIWFGINMNKLEIETKKKMIEYEENEKKSE